MPAGKIVLIVEHADGAIRPISYELAAAARAMAALTKAAPIAVVLDSDPVGVATRFAAETGIDIVAVTLPGLDAYLSESYLVVLPGLLHEIDARMVCIGHTSWGWDFAPGLAVALQAACLTAVEAVALEGGRLFFRRTTHQGKIVSHVATFTDHLVITIQPGAFVWTPRTEAVTGSVTRRTINVQPRSMRCLGFVPAPEAERDLDAAEVIVTVGRGLGSRDNLESARRLAAAFPKGALAGSRPACDAGWLPYNRQVGQTGAVVRPKVYLACGISGAAQHTYGMKESGFIVAINKDPYAPIFRLADVGITEDVTAFLPILLAEIAAAKNPH